MFDWVLYKPLMFDKVLNLLLVVQYLLKIYMRVIMIKHISEIEVMHLNQKDTLFKPCPLLCINDISVSQWFL